MRRTAFFILASGLLASACTTTPEPSCRPASEAERQLFGHIVAHNEAALADAMAPGAAETAQRLRELDPALEAQVFGERMGDRSVRTVLMRPPLCVYDAEITRDEKIAYVFPAGRFEALQNPEQPGPELGTPAIDHAACRFVQVEGQWRLAAACTATFAPITPAS